MLKQLPLRDIKRLAKGDGVRQKAVENFLIELPRRFRDQADALNGLEFETMRKGWDYYTQYAIYQGIKMAAI